MIFLQITHNYLRYLNGTIDAPLARCHRNRTRYKVVNINETGWGSEKIREATTNFSVIQKFQDFTFLKLFPLTGRTHQIRVHLSDYGNPVLGDRIYGKRHTFERLALHAYSLEFSHPITKNIIRSYSFFPKIFRAADSL